MMELSNGHGLSSPRSPRNHDAFPAGLRVLVVDDDLTWLKILEKMLKKCNYEVTICGLARDALKLLRERKDAFDIVLSDVNMPDMDGFKLLELVGLEMDLPVIMMSVDGETSRVKKGVQHGACDYLLKPIRMKELRNIWQHVFRKRIHEVRDIEYLEGLEGVQMARSGYDRFDNGHFYNGEDMPSTKKRRDLETKHEDKDYADPSCSSKKARVVWSVELHQKFVKAVNQIGYDKVGPKKILDLMNVSWLTRENVASHLQKYRLYLSRLQKENDLKTSFGGMKPSDPTPQDAAGNSGHQINLHQNDVANGNFRFSSNNLLIQNLKSKSNESDTKGMMVADQSNHPGSSTSQKDFTSLFRPQESEAKYVAYEPITPRQYYWREVPEIQFQQANDPKLGKDSFGHVPMPGLQNRIQVDQPERAPSISQKARLTEIELPGPIETKPLYADYTVNNFTQASPVKSGLSSFSVPGKGHALNPQVHESVSINTLSTISQGFDSSCITDLESSQKDLSSATESPFVSPDEVLQLGWLQDSYYPTSLGTQNLELSDFVDPSIITGVPMHLYDALKFDYDQVSDQSDLSIINQGLFIA